MKYNKNFFRVTLISLTYMVLSLPCYNAVKEPTRIKKIFPVSKSVGSIVRNYSMLEISVPRGAHEQERIEGIEKRLRTFPITSSIVLDGGTYDRTMRAKEYEVHHLISASFCRNHPERLSINQAPCVTIPKHIHKLTGSHIGSGKANMQEYLKGEEEIYRQTKSLQAVYQYGVINLINVLRKCGHRDMEIKELLDSTPSKRAASSLYKRTPSMVNRADKRYIPTPRKESCRKRLSFL